MTAYKHFSLKAILVAWALALCGILSPIQASAQDGIPWFSNLKNATYAQSGKKFEPKAYFGKKSIMMFWRSDCAPCLVEVAGFDKVRQAAGNIPIIMVVPSFNKKDQYFLQKPIKYSAHIVLYKGNYNKMLEYFGDPEGGVPYSVMFDENGKGCISNLGPVNSKTVKDMYAECR